MTATFDLLHLMNAADRTVPERVGEAMPDIARAADGIADRLDAGGRCLYVGAGTSGRLGALDAAELPPTFGTDPALVVALLAGGPDAMLKAVEGAEDDEAAAARDLAGVTPRDAVVAIAASGTTPYALAALRHARAAGALTVAVVCAGGTPLAALAEIPIVVDVGPEVLSGSTRLKAGTAQKLVLNMLSTAVFARRGLVYQGEMVAVRPTNAKLRKRAVRIASRLLAIPGDEAETLLGASGWNLPVALVSGRWKLSVEDARAYLARVSGNVARALEHAP